jgi:hypothetical protein
MRVKIVGHIPHLGLSGEESSPGTGLDVEGESENVPFTIHLTGRDLGKQSP